MIRILCTTFFILGCSAQTRNAAPELPPSSSGVHFTSASETIEHPCTTGDLSCVRRYFRHHSKCSPAPGLVHEPVIREYSRGSYPSGDIELTALHALYKGFNTGKIKDFYINRHTDKLVMNIELRDYRRLCNDTFYAYYKKGRESVITHGYTRVYANSVFVTVIIPHVDDLQFDAFKAFAYSDSSPVFDIDPHLGHSSDPSIRPRFTTFLGQPNQKVVLKEFWHAERLFLAATYIQNFICDFGLHVE